MERNTGLPFFSSCELIKKFCAKLLAPLKIWLRFQVLELVRGEIKDHRIFNAKNSQTVNAEKWGKLLINK